MPNNVLAVVKYPKSDIVLPMIVRGGMLVEGAKILRPTSNREFLKLLPVADFEQSSKDALARHLEYHDASCEQFMQTIEEELRRHCDEDTAPYKLLLPITPHAKKNRRARVRKSVSRRCTRSSRQSNLNLSIGKSLSQRQSTIKLALEKSLSLTTPNNTCLTKSIVVVTPKQRQSHRPSEQLNQYMPDVILSATPKSGGDGRSPEENHDKMNGIEHMESDAMVEQNDSLEGTLAEKQPSCKIDDAGRVNVEMEDADEEMEEVPSATPIPIQKLISLHETLIEKQHVSSCIINSAVGAVNKDEHEEKHASPELTSKKGSQNAATEKRSADDQIRSCMKKNPVISLVKLGEAPTENSPQQNLVLNFEGSDEEDIADGTAEHAMKMFEPVTTKDKLLKSGKPTIHKTPVRVGQTAARRSLVLKLRLSSSESELDSSAVSQAADEDVDQHDEQAYALQDMPLQDSLEEDTHDDTMEKEHPSINTTSQASSSVCSSTAATVVLSEEEEQVDKMEAPAEVRRSMRTRGGHRPSVVTSIAAKRVSMSMKLKAKKQAAEAKTMKRVVASGSDDGTSSATSSESPKKRPKIVKPVLKSNCKLPKPSASGSSKRTRNAFLGSPGFQSPSQPKAKRTRATFLNRSTAASRSRRTPTKSASSERTRGVLLMSSPYKFGGPSTCHTPNRGLGNLTVEVTSFIRRNTPQKVNPDEELAAKKQQLEEKQKREEQLKKKRDEEKLRKLAEKRKKRSMRLRKAAELREKREKEEKEKQLQKAEQWKKKLADANKVKVLRKKDETEKIKKLQKKQAEAEEVRRREEEERIRKIQEQEMEKDHRLQEKRLQKEHEALIKKQAEQEKMKERQRQDRIREEKEEAELQKKQEEEYLKREEERAKQRMVEETARLRQIKADREEAERRKKLQEEETKRIAEAAKQEQLRLQKEEEAQQKYQEEAKKKQEELARKKEREELRLAAQKKKMEEAQALLDEKARKRKEEEMARAEELRQRREEMRKRAERKREEERLQVKEEKKRAEEQKKKEREEAEQEKMRQIQEANRKLRELEEQHRKEKERLQNMENNAMNRTYTLNPDQSELGSPQSYDITPHSHHYKKKNFAPSTAENYNIDDLASGDSTDDDMTPRKVVPRWAKGGSLRSVLVRQYYSPPDLRIIFKNALSLDEVQLHEIFRVRKPRYFHRTSSAQWNSPIMPPGHISFTEHCKGFD